MKKTITGLLLIILLISCTEHSSIKEINSSWSEQDRATYLKNRNDASTWDLEMFESDKQMIGIGDIGPFEIGVFPNPTYDLVGSGSFQGLTNKNEDFAFKNQHIVMNSFFVGKNELNKVLLKDLEDEAFFQILVLSDTVDNENYQLNKSVTISRNHPDYLAQGFILTKQMRIDYVAFQTAEQNAYAIVNTRIFDLNAGKTILISPQKDGTLRSLQIKSPPLTSADILTYTNELIMDKEIIAFFERE